MKIQLDWLKTYIDHGLSVQKLSDLLTMGAHSRSSALIGPVNSGLA